MNLDELRGQISQTLQESGISLKSLSKELGTKGVSTGTLSLFLNGKYDGDNHEISQKLEEWFALRTHREEINIPPNEWIETPTAKSIWVTILYAHANCKMAAIYGMPGVGKTMTCVEYASKDYYKVELSGAEELQISGHNDKFASVKINGSLAPVEWRAKNPTDSVWGKMYRAKN